MAPNEPPLPVRLDVPESETSEPEPKVPAYVRRVWKALKLLSDSPKVKAHAAELFAQAVDRYLSAHNAANPFNKPPQRPQAMFEVPEKIAFLCIALSVEEKQTVVDVVEALLRDTPAAADTSHYPHYLGT